MNIAQSLAHIGLEEKEAQIYAFLLKQPRSADMTAFRIARGVDMPRSTAYVILESLEQKKLVSSYKKNNVLHYLTANPSRLQRNLEEKQELLSSLLPTLENLSKDSAFVPSVQTFTGASGVKTVFDDIFDNPRENGVREYHTISHPKLIQYIPKQFPKYMAHKKKLDLHSKLIVPAEAMKSAPPEYENNSHRETRLLPPGFTFEGTLIIYGRKTALFSHRDNEVISMIVDSSAITEMIDAVFMCLWDLLPQRKKEAAKA
jgi:sugar-specific transcriptional regulator TrmB